MSAFLEEKGAKIHDKNKEQIDLTPETLKGGPSKKRRPVQINLM